MNDSPLQRFIDLVTIDQTIIRLENDSRAIDTEIDSCQQEKTKADSILESAKKNQHDARKEVDAKELEMKVLDQQEKEKKVKLDKTQNSKEAQSLYQEIENLKKKQHELEVGLLTAWRTYEIAQKNYEQEQQKYEAQIQTLDAQINEKLQKKNDLKKQIENVAQEREQKIHDIPAEWLEKYAMMRSQVTNPVVPVENGACSACFYHVSAQDLSQLRRRVMLQCKQCFRFLYLNQVINEAT